jgi:hypothetical protein
LKKKDEIKLAKELELILSRIRDENRALFRLIEALRKTEEPHKKEKIQKSNQ